MKRVQQACEDLPAWLATCNIDMRGVEIQSTKWGSGIVTKRKVNQEDGPIIVVPSELVLSQKFVWKQAEMDVHLRECLEALGEFTKTARGAILVFILLQIAATSPDMPERIGIDNTWTTYVQYLPNEEGLPTSWSDLERQYAEGTSLAPAIESKMKSLRREFEGLKDGLQHISWCKKYWFEPVKGCLSLNDWVLVDSIYRSRAMEMPTHGLCMVPIADMANHGHDRRVNARTDVEHSTGNVRLVIDRFSSVGQGAELFITYGDEKGACEMLFSYGFIDQDMTRAESIFLELQAPEDDPIFLAKKHAFDCAPGVRLSYKMQSPEIKWIGPFVWLLCINEEDGLGFEVERPEDGGKRLKATWKNKELKDVLDLDDAIQSDEMYDLFRLRGFVSVNERIKAELTARDDVLKSRYQQSWWKSRNESSTAWRNTEHLRKLEHEMLTQAEYHFNNVIRWLYSSKVVKRYFNGAEDSEDMWAWYNESEDGVKIDESELGG